MEAGQQAGRNKVVGENIRKFRIQKGLTQDELVEGLCSVSQLSKIETGKAGVKDAVLQAIANRLGVTVEQLSSADAILDELRESFALAKDAYEAGNVDYAIQLNRETIPKARELGYWELLTDLVIDYGYDLFFGKHDYPGTIEVMLREYEQGLTFTPNQQVVWLFQLGQAYQYSGNRVAAYECYCQAEDAYQQVEDDPNLSLRIPYVMAKTQFWVQNYARAIRYADKTAQLATVRNQHRYRIRALSFKAISLMEHGDWEEAEELYQEILKAEDTNSMISELCVDLYNYGYFCMKRKKYGLAVVQLQRSLKLSKVMGDHYYISNPLLVLSEVALLEGDLLKTEDYLRQFFDLATESTQVPYVRKACAHHLLGKVRLAQGNFSEYVRLMEEALNIYGDKHIGPEPYEAAVELAEAMHERGDARAVLVYRRAIAYNQKWQAAERQIK